MMNLRICRSFKSAKNVWKSQIRKSQKIYAPQIANQQFWSANLRICDMRSFGTSELLCGPPTFVSYTDIHSQVRKWLTRKLHDEIGQHQALQWPQIYTEGGRHLQFMYVYCWQVIFHDHFVRTLHSMCSSATLYTVQHICDVVAHHYITQNHSRQINGLQNFGYYEKPKVVIGRRRCRRD